MALRTPFLLAIVASLTLASSSPQRHSSSRSLASLSSLWSLLVGEPTLADPNWTFDEARNLVLTSSAGSGVTLVDRKTWDPRNKPGPMSDQTLSQIHTIVIHNSETPENDEKILRSLVEGHTKGRGWSDIGYHFILAIDSKNGGWKVYEGRPLEKEGAHAGSRKDRKTGREIDLNANTIGICILGSYAWKTEAKQKEVQELVPGRLRNTPAGNSMLKRLLSAFAEPTAHESLRQPPREAVQTLVELIHTLGSDLRLEGLRKIQAHGALAGTDLQPRYTAEKSAQMAINPGHTDCPGHGLLHIVEALQARFHSEWQSREAPSSKESLEQEPALDDSLDDSLESRTQDLESTTNR